MNIEAVLKRIEYELGDLVFFITDEDKKPYIVTEIVIGDNTIRYLICHQGDPQLTVSRYEIEKINIEA